MSFKPIEPKRDEFRKYLERSGAIEALTKLFVKLFHENDRPENPMEFIRENFGDSILCQQVIKDLKLELNDLKAENKALKDILQKNGLEAPENEATEEAIFQSQSALSAVEMQETINKENLKRNSQKHAGSVESVPQGEEQKVVPTEDSPAVAEEPVDNSAVNIEAEAPVVQQDPVQEQEPEEKEEKVPAKDGGEDNVTEGKPNEEAQN
ncbi:MYCBP family protein [Megaselia abdita]